MSAKGLVRSISSPIRNFINQHFEAVKDEVRAQSARVIESFDGRAANGDGTAQLDEAWRTVGQLENSMLEAMLHQSVTINKLSATCEQLGERIESLERSVNRVAAVLAEVISEPIE